MGGREASLCSIGSAIITRYNGAAYINDKVTALTILQEYDAHHDACRRCKRSDGVEED